MKITPTLKKEFVHLFIETEMNYAFEGDEGRPFYEDLVLSLFLTKDEQKILFEFIEGCVNSEEDEKIDFNKINELLNLNTEEILSSEEHALNQSKLF